VNRPGRGRGTRFLALGDSYTIGESVAAGERWPVQLAAKLREARVAIDDPTIIARTGWTTDELSGAIDAARPVGPFDLVTLLVGVNDQYRGRPVTAFERPFGALLARAIAFAAGRADRVIAISIPDWGVTPFAAGRDRGAIAAEIDAYNAVVQRAARIGRTHHIDVTAISRRAATEPGLLAGDGLHPSGRMYAEWVGVLLPVARTALGVRQA
jgi:lysophospholipase L1-like esterase